MSPFHIYIYIYNSTIFLKFEIILHKQYKWLKKMSLKMWSTYFNLFFITMVASIFLYLSVSARIILTIGWKKYSPEALRINHKSALHSLIKKTRKTTPSPHKQKPKKIIVTTMPAECWRAFEFRCLFFIVFIFKGKISTDTGNVPNC